MSDVLDALRDALGNDAVLTGAAIPDRHRTDWSTLAPVEPRALVRPRSTEEVAAVLRICHARGQGVVPQGGMTGLSGGARPRREDIALSLERLSGVEEVDAATATLTALAGTPLATVQQAAEDAGFLCALDLGARGSCSIGGNVATNAGGNRVVRYGMARDLVLGLEVVLADGSIIRSLNKMLKNNSGYDVKQLFIGTEGTLGVVTRVVLKLHPRPASACNALVGVADFARVVRLLRRAQAELGGTLSSFEVMWPSYYDFMTDNVAGLDRPLADRHGYYVLIEATGPDVRADPGRFEAFLAARLEAGDVADAVIAQSGAAAKALWAVRDATAEYPRLFGEYVGFDVSFPIGIMDGVTSECERRLRERWPAIVALFYGHIGDSNLHLVCHVPGARPQPADEIEALVYALLREAGGAVSAEHGIGTVKRAWLGHSRTPEEIALMRTLKAALDPQGVLNPGKVL